MVTEDERRVADASRERLAGLAGPFLSRPGVTWGRMFSTEGLGVRGKIFAVVTHVGDLMAKVPEARADELVADGKVTRMIMRGREMREWVVSPADADDAAWIALLDESYAYLDAITPGG
ncbi:TfoX/Sxy family protein [Homoserinibacter sp. GY 40078]|uniref:TfoX/Sxy family protein n=1 Tax=Homoserinibacter sp. GY 40078 TaxID=2603275 RepID=UPI0011C98FCA|nr:TfoX/Sxy family protein [Homoserinibacter sp. GY 40078]TXK16956.1 hypothetical protein FVQ89_08705 [Homoserinibacter sp. GY 40078]